MSIQAKWKTLVTFALLPLAAACSDDANLTGPGGGNGSGGTVSLSVSVPAGAGGSAAFTGPGAFDIVLVDGASTLTITRAAMILREIELELMNDDDCDDHLPGLDDDCEEFETGPTLIELPMDGSVDQVLTINDVEPGVYDEVEFEVHKLGDDPADLAFLAEPGHAIFDDVSILVEGTFDDGSASGAQAFVFTTDLNEEQERALFPPIEVTDVTSSVNVTLSIDVSTWFDVPGSSLVNPASANKGGPNEGVVKENIKNSIDAFEDDDHDGEDDRGSS
jgi:hypothetical protein